MNFSSHQLGDASMKKLAYAAILFALATTAASAQSPQTAPKAVPEGPAAKILASIPANAMTVTHWYKQSVYDPSDAKVGEIMDVLVDRESPRLSLASAGFLEWARRTSQFHSMPSSSRPKTITSGIP